MAIDSLSFVAGMLVASGGCRVVCRTRDDGSDANKFFLVCRERDVALVSSALRIPPETDDTVFKLRPGTRVFKIYGTMADALMSAMHKHLPEGNIPALVDDAERHRKPYTKKPEPVPIEERARPMVARIDYDKIMAEWRAEKEATNVGMVQG